MDVSRRGFLAATGAFAAGTIAPGHLLAAAAKHTPPPPDLSRWSDVRALFPLRRDLAHFAGFYLVSHPRPIRDAIDAFRRALDENPIATVDKRMGFETETDSVLLDVCRAAAKYMGAAGEDIALTPNTTTGLALVYHGLPLSPGDEMLVTEHDHYVHHESVRTAALHAGATTRRIALYDDASQASVAEITARIAREIRPETRVLGATWVHSSTGVRLPIRAIADVVARANAQRDPTRPVWFVVDGVHGFGCVDEDAASLGCDFFSAGTHKWLFAPRGTGVLWGRSDRWPLLRPTIPSFASLPLFKAWMENEPPGPTTAAMISPGGFLAYEHQWAMSAAFQMHERMGRARVAARIRTLNDQLKQGLLAMRHVRVHTPKSPELSAGIVAFEVDGMKPETIVEKLLEKRIVASTSPYRVSYARLAASLVNDEREVDAALRAVREIAGA